MVAQPPIQVVRAIILAAAVTHISTSAMAQQAPRAGIAIDAQGVPAVDPTKNVLDLVLAAVKRIDDVLELTVKRQDDLRAAQAALEELRYSTIKENIALRADNDEKLRKAESGRLDAIRIVDTNNVTVANERAGATATALQKKGDDSALVLSAQVTKSADDVRTLVKTTADEQSRNLQQQFAAIQAQFTQIGARLTTLEQTGAEGLGKQKFQDPQQAAALATLTEEMRKISRAQADTAGTSAGRNEIIGYVFGALGALAALLIWLFNRMAASNVQPVLPVEPVYRSRKSAS